MAAPTVYNSVRLTQRCRLNLSDIALLDILGPRPLALGPMIQYYSQ